MPNLKDIKFTKHAEDMLIERGFQRDFIENVVSQPEWTERGEVEMWYAFKRIEKKVLRVVVKGENPSTVITMYFDRRIK